MEKSGKKCLATRVFFFAVFAMSFFSCATRPKFEGRSEIVGKVVDSKGKGIQDCIVTLDGTKTAATNSTGIFVLRDIASGNHKISVQKENYSIEKKEFPFLTRQTFLTVKCKDGTEIFSEAEDYLDQRDLESAKSVLKTLKKSDGNEKFLYFYEQLIEYLENPNKRRKKNLASLSMRGEK